MDLNALTTLWSAVPGFMLVMARMGGMFVVAPVLGGPYLPPHGKVLLTIAISLIVFPLAHTGTIALDGWFMVLLMQELLVGMCFGFVLSLFFHGIQMGGEFINRHAGFTAAENFDPETQVGSGPMADILFIGAVMLLMAMDGHHLMIATLAKSYTVLPIGGYRITPEFQGVLGEGVRQMWEVALALSFPVLVAVMGLTVAEAVISRALPQINVQSVSFAIKIGVSVLVMWSAMPAALAFIGTTLIAMQELSSAALRALG